MVKGETSRDHVPSKSLLLKPYPQNLPVAQVCKSCNAGFSLDEEYLAAFLGAVLAGSADRHDNPDSARILQQRPKLRARIEAAKSQYRTCEGEVRTLWKPEAARIERVIVKNARGHVLFEIGEPMLKEPRSVRFTPLESFTTEQRTDFERLDFGSGWPEIGSRATTRFLTGQDLVRGWIVVQSGVYRYAVAQRGVTLVRAVLFEYLATEVCWD